MINEKLEELYLEKIKGVRDLSHLDDEIDGPLLMKCWEDEYLGSDFKILFVGQECNGWMGYLSDNVHDCLTQYEGFELSKNGNRTVFWQYVYWINALLNPEKNNRNNFLWTNASKFCTSEGLGLEWSIHKEIVTHFNCLVEEIKIVAPDVIIFFTGPNYDEKLRVQFEGDLEFDLIFEDIPVRELARVNHPNLPQNSFRVYHPGALQRQSKYGYLVRLVEHIKNDI